MGIGYQPRKASMVIIVAQLIIGIGAARAGSVIGDFVEHDIPVVQKVIENTAAIVAAPATESINALSRSAGGENLFPSTLKAHMFFLQAVVDGNASFDQAIFQSVDGLAIGLGASGSNNDLRRGLDLAAELSLLPSNATMLGLGTAAAFFGECDGAIDMAAAHVERTRQYYLLNARPLHADFQTFASAVIDKDLLGQVRIANAVPGELNIPALTIDIGELPGTQSGASAVTIDNLILFAKDINESDHMDPSDLFFILHELRHVEQYKERGGAKGFYQAYSTYDGCQALERDADVSADIRLSRLVYQEIPLDKLPKHQCVQFLGCSETFLNGNLSLER
jgi:hypothetical protein